MKACCLYYAASKLPCFRQNPKAPLQSHSALQQAEIHKEPNNFDINCLVSLEMYCFILYLC